MSQPRPTQPASPQHRDASGRLSRVKYPTQEQYLRPSDGRLTLLKVQGTSYGGELSQAQRGDARNWRYIGRQGSRIPFTMRFVCWMYSLYLRSKGSEEDDQPGDGSMLTLAVVWIPCCILLALMLFIPQNFVGEIRNGGYYDPVRYRDWRYAKSPRNQYERQARRPATRKEANEPEDETQPFLQEGDMEMGPISHYPTTTTTRTLASSEAYNYNSEKLPEKLPDELMQRHTGPRYLCFLDRNPDGYKVREDRRGFANTDFVFVSYTRQLFVVDTEPEIAADDKLSQSQKEAKVKLSREDRATLVQYGVEAARAAHVGAFWIDFECILDYDGVARAHSKSEDVYRICDIARVAHSMIVVFGPSKESRLNGGPPETYSPSTMNMWMQEYGSRLWTLPELLLCPPEHRIQLYVVGLGAIEEVAKRNLASRALWRDADLVRQLMDHYESTIHLTPLELVSIALECLTSRHTNQFTKGDIAYVLMGLLRRRPMVIDTDTSFEAFARLSLANVNDSLLERLICMQPVRRNAPWHEIKDAWGARLWDIEPRCQVAGVADDQTVILDGTFGATIQWDRMEQVAFYKRRTVARTIAIVAVRALPTYLLAGLVMTITATLPLGGSGSDYSENLSYYRRDSVSPGLQGLLAVGIVVLIPAIIITLLAPIMLWDLYRGKFWSTQALLIGMEGVPENLGWVEKDLFGLDHGRLKWSVAGSTLSQHTTSKDGECVAQPPDLSPPPPDFESGVEAVPAEREREFTLIDTYSMTATAFRAVRPPSALIVCGQEGGMQRAVLCSYDWQSATFAREAVVRVKTTVLDRLSRVDRFRFALRRKVVEQSQQGR
ncbi:hypothetical protein GGR52DRAFT_538493 [Hypoxylon sp. FL1284]|nr:hypothetical protein GGR52DRAFT_538493 [Hypoxylon sp. FL1284]